jgi:hypothetical protein
MIRHLYHRLVRELARRSQFLRRENGNATIEFVILFPLFFGLLVSSVEIGFITLRHTILDRAVDMTVREIRMSTRNPLQYEQVRDAICDRAPIISDCQSNLKIEMIRMDLRAWVPPPADFDCINHAEEVQPVRTFQNGMQNEMMLLRICAIYKPVFPLAALGRDLQRDGPGGYAAMLSAAAFVQEPL